LFCTALLWFSSVVRRTCAGNPKQGRPAAPAPPLEMWKKNFKRNEVDPQPEAILLHPRKLERKFKKVLS